MKMTLKRPRSFGDRNLDAFLDEIVDTMQVMTAASLETGAAAAEPEAGAQVASVMSSQVSSVGGSQYIEYRVGVNDGATVITRWLIVGLDAQSKPTRSIGGTTSVRPLGVSTRDSVPGHPLYLASGGVMNIYVQTGVSPQRGDPCYVSATQAGRVTSLAPTTGQRFLIGTFWGPLGSDGRAEVVLFLSLTGARTI